jgi:hypothetical protein
MGNGFVWVEENRPRSSGPHLICNDIEILYELPFGTHWVWLIKWWPHEGKSAKRFEIFSKDTDVIRVKVILLVPERKSVNANRQHEFKIYTSKACLHQNCQ